MKTPFVCSVCTTLIPVENVGAVLLEGNWVVRCHVCGAQLTIGIVDAHAPEDEAEPGEEYGPCPRRREGGPWRLDDRDRWVETRWKGEGDWRLEWFPRSCSFCGSIHPDDAFRLLEEGWEVGATRKPYKVYLEPPGTGEASRVELEAIREKGVEGLADIWRPVPPVKLYAQHLTAELAACIKGLPIYRRNG